MHLPARFLAGFGQCFDEILPVNVIHEYFLPPISPTHHIIDGTRIFDAQFAWHGVVGPLFDHLVKL